MLGNRRATSAHLHRDWAHPCHICTMTWACDVGSPLQDLLSCCPHLHRDCARPADTSTVPWCHHRVGCLHRTRTVAAGNFRRIRKRPSGRRKRPSGCRRRPFLAQTSEPSLPETSVAFGNFRRAAGNFRGLLETSARRQANRREDLDPLEAEDLGEGAARTSAARAATRCVLADARVAHAWAVARTSPEVISAS